MNKEIGQAFYEVDDAKNDGLLFSVDSEDLDKLEKFVEIAKMIEAENERRCVEDELAKVRAALRVAVIVLAKEIARSYQSRPGDPQATWDRLALSEQENFVNIAHQRMDDEQKKMGEL